MIHWLQAVHDYGRFEMRLFICVYVGWFVCVVVRVYRFPSLLAHLCAENTPGIALSKPVNFISQYNRSVWYGCSVISILIRLGAGRSR